MILEGMMHGVACVSTDEGGIPDIIDDGNTGLIAHRCDAADLADKLQQLLDDADLRRRMGEAGYAKYIDMPVNWCEELGTVLSNDEVIDGKSERG